MLGLRAPILRNMSSARGEPRGAGVYNNKSHARTGRVEELELWREKWPRQFGCAGRKVPFVLERDR